MKNDLTLRFRRLLDTAFGANSYPGSLPVDLDHLLYDLDNTRSIVRSALDASDRDTAVKKLIEIQVYVDDLSGPVGDILRDLPPLLDDGDSDI